LVFVFEQFITINRNWRSVESKEEGEGEGEKGEPGGGEASLTAQSQYYPRRKSCNAKS